jgi:hypothetical protein
MKRTANRDLSPQRTDLDDQALVDAISADWNGAT